MRAENPIEADEIFVPKALTFKAAAYPVSHAKSNSADVRLWVTLHYFHNAPHCARALAAKRTVQIRQPACHPPGAGSNLNLADVSFMR